MVELTFRFLQNKLSQDIDYDFSKPFSSAKQVMKQDKHRRVPFREMLSNAKSKQTIPSVYIKANVCPSVCPSVCHDYLFLGC